ncbi:hypothetical protein KUTeg_013739 [Tegillarca granosa]|uniref:HELP domain-containing protein n=1 Tax=Tegillarca granosa TaxID=220873 RepID=A0ABQ9EZQ0_TEGGR|nr:hypothetical protein KUTeg_013739 [Tegillarca granosa]
MDDSSVILTNGVDGLLSNDHEELSERVSYLEKKVRQQEDEIICLKSALADAIPSGQSSGSRESTKEPLWNQEEGYLKIYLRGRAVNLYAPSSVADYNVSKIANAPEEKLRLEWVYGYRGRDCRNNLYYLPTGEIIYFIAGVVILQNVEENTQRHYTGHTDDVKCIAIHPDKVKIASGQVAGHDKNSGKPHVRIWDSVSLNTLHVIGIGDFDRAVCCLSFSKLDGGQHLVVVDEANEHVISVWGFAKDKPHKLTETKSSTEPVLAAEFHPLEKNSIITCGKGQISFWTIEGGTLAKKTGIFDKHEKPKYVLCLAFADNGDVISGDSNGNIFIWPKGNNRISQAITGIHDGGIFSICVMKDGTVLSGGGKDRKIVQFDSTYKPTGVEYEIPENFGGVRTLSQGQGGLVLVGATRNCILQGTIDLKLTPVVLKTVLYPTFCDDVIIKFDLLTLSHSPLMLTSRKSVMQGHTDELWGLASHPTQHQFMTSGSDKHIQLWDSMTRTVIWSKEIPSGRWLIIDLSTHEIVVSHTDGSEQIECLQYSPDGNYLALGSRDNYIYVYEVTEAGTMPNCKQVTSSSSLREVQWATQNCTLAFNTAGIWPDGADGTDVNACCKSNKQHLLASADDFGKVKLYKYPCCQPKIKWKLKVDKRIYLCKSMKMLTSNIIFGGYNFELLYIIIY